jgi:Flp pilus assembly pilin Flp
MKRLAAKLTSWPQRFCRVLKTEEGQAMAEYAVILVLVGVVVLLVLMVLGNQVRNVFCNISGALTVPRGPG